MYLIAPLVLIGISLLGIVLIVRRKMPYLRKLSPDAHEVSDNLWEDFFPELLLWLRQIKWQEYRQNSLKEIEKLLRRSRLVLMKIDHASEQLIRKVRHIHLAKRLENTAIQTDKPAEEKSPSEVSDIKPIQSTLDDLKAREQQLIIDISQDPKNAILYENLGDLYVKMGHEQDAREAYEASLKITPDNESLSRKYSELLKKTEKQSKQFLPA